MPWDLMGWDGAQEKKLARIGKTCKISDALGMDWMGSDTMKDKKQTEEDDADALQVFAFSP